MVTVVNSKADVLKASAALSVNVGAARGLTEVMRSNLGPRGAVKMLVGGAGQIKITKDGCVLLGEMQIQHPTASMIARAATAQDDITGDGTTTNVLFIAELMKLSERLIVDGVHPRVLVDGFETAKEAVVKYLDEHFKYPLAQLPGGANAAVLSLAKTALRTKLPQEFADQLAGIVVEAVQIVKTNAETSAGGLGFDLNMVEVMAMKERLATEMRLVRGLVLDHGSRNAEMPKELFNCHILTLNVSLEYEKTEVHSTFLYSSAEHRDKLVDSERRFTDEKVKKIIELKQAVCKTGEGFVVVNQKGIDPPSLEMLAREGIIALRRAKRRNMERLVLACGGNALNSVEDMTKEDLGFAEHVFERSLSASDDKFTFIEGVRHPSSCTILLKGPNDHTIAQLKDAVRDGLRAVQNAYLDEALVPGAGAFEVAAADYLLTKIRPTVQGKAKLGVQVFAEALLVVPRTLAENSGLDAQEAVLKLQEAWELNKHKHHNGAGAVGLDLITGEVMAPAMEGVWDNFIVKKQLLGLAPVLAEQLLLVDEVIRAGRQMKPE